MAAQFRNSLRNTRASAINTDIGTSGKLKIYTSAYGTLLATYVWTGTNMFGSPSTGVMTMLAPAASTVAGSGTGAAAIAKITTSADVDVIKDLTVATSAADVIIDNTSINSGQNVVLDYANCTITEGNAGF